MTINLLDSRHVIAVMSLIDINFPVILMEPEYLFKLNKKKNHCLIVVSYSHSLLSQIGTWYYEGRKYPYIITQVQQCMCGCSQNNCGLSSNRKMVEKKEKYFFHKKH